MAVTHLSSRQPLTPSLRRTRAKAIRHPRATRRDSRHAGGTRRRAYRASQPRTFLDALRALWMKAGRTLTSRFTTRAMASLASIVTLVIECVALHSVLVA